jgi:ribose transport system permease protein
MTDITTAGQASRLADLVQTVRQARMSTWMVVGLLVASVVANAAVQSNFFTAYSLTSTTATLVPLALVALAQAIVVIGGGIDLSIGASVTVASVSAVVVMDGREGAVLLGAAVAIAVGAACGLVNGLIIALLRLQPIIVTFATSSVFAGAALLVLPTPGGSVPGTLTRAYRDSVLGVPTGAWLLVAILLLWAFMARTRLVRHVYAVGGDPVASYASLIPVPRVQVLSYVLCGALGGVAAIALLANSGSGDPFVGLGMTLDSVAAVVIGGIALSGGRGSGIGAVAGAVTLALIENTIFFAGVPTNYRPLASGLVIIVALALSAFTMADRRRRA